MLFQLKNPQFILFFDKLANQISYPKAIQRITICFDIP